MTDFKTLNEGQKDIVRAQNAAIQKLPENLNERMSIWNDDEKRRKVANDKIAQIKKDVGLSEGERLLTERYGYSPQAIRWIRQLRKMPTLEAASAVSLFLGYAKDHQLHYPTLFDAAGYGVGSDDAPGETAGFDKTSEGQRRGGEDAQPRTTEEMAASHEPKGTGPGLSYDEIVAGFTKAEEAWKANGSKPGRKPKDYVEAKAALDAANAERGGEPGEVPPAPEPAKPDNVVNFTKQQKDANKAGDDHIRKQSEEKAASRASKATTAREEKKPSTRGKKADAAPAANPALADDDDEEAPAAAPPPGQIGSTAPSFRIG